VVKPASGDRTLGLSNDLEKKIDILSPSEVTDRSPALMRLQRSSNSLQTGKRTGNSQFPSRIHEIVPEFPCDSTALEPIPYSFEQGINRLNREGILSDQGAVDENLVRSRSAYWRCRRSGLRVAMAFLLAWE
jgi:hypothetical protein